MNKIHMTKDYSIFTSHEYQRRIDTRLIVKSMKNNGYIEAYPIYTIKNGSGLKVIDGHHRLEGAKKLGLPVHYIVCEKEAQMKDIDGGIRKWTLLDYLTHYVEKGKDSYIYIKTFQEKSKIPLGVCICLHYGISSNGGPVTDKFRSGDYVINDFKHPQMVQKVLDVCVDLNLNFVRNHTFIYALSRVLRLDEVDCGQLINRIRVNAGDMRQFSGMKDNLIMLESVYNKRSHTKTPIAFLAQEKAKENYRKYFRK